MGKITRFEDLICWQRSHVLVDQVFRLCSQESVRRNRSLCDQMERASLSIMTNIAEGFARYSIRDFLHFLDISQSSASELESLLYVVSDRHCVDESRLNDIRTLCEEVHNLILGLVKYLRKKIDSSGSVHSGAVRENDENYTVDFKKRMTDFPADVLNPNG